jgi:FKBP-type peptidyl-prolyl cis-trans isomerase FklB
MREIVTILPIAPQFVSRLKTKEFLCMCWKLTAISALILGGAFFGGAQAQDKPGGTPQRGAAQKAPPLIVGDAPKGNASTSDVSYFIGYDFGTGLTSQGFSDKDIDVKELVAGISEALAKKKIRLNDDQIQSCVGTLTALVQKKQVEAQQQMLELAKANLEKAKKYLEENKKKDGVQTTQSGLQYKILKSGTGDQPKFTDMVVAHYEGKTIEGTIFDSSIQRNEPAKFQLQKVVKGFSEALQRMKVGDKWIVTIPPDLAYGEAGRPGIAPNEALIFELELLEIVKQ